MEIDILRVINEGFTKKTNIMARANLSWSATEDLMKRLLDLKLIDNTADCELGGSILYSLTPRGVEVLRSYERIEDLTNPELIIG